MKEPTPVEPPHESIVEDELAAVLTAPTSAVPDHQRPDGVVGEWELIPREEWNKDQEIAAKTHGIVTRASAISVAGLAITTKGLWDIYKGNYVKGGAEVAIGRTFDLWDGAEAKKRGTRSKPGAGIDAGVDKELVATAAALLTKAGVTSKEYASATLAQEARIFAENARIQKAGGEPNPSKAGKIRMAVVWAAFMGRITETALRHRGYDKAARVAGGVALTAEFGSLGMGEHVISGYRKQRKSLKK